MNVHTCIMMYITLKYAVLLDNYAMIDVDIFILIQFIHTYVHYHIHFSHMYICLGMYECIKLLTLDYYTFVFW